MGLLDLFEGLKQLVIHHFMWINDTDADGTEHPRDAGCPSCSSVADGIGNPRQLHVRNTTLVAVSRAPYEKIAAFRERMGWTFPRRASASRSTGPTAGTWSPVSRFTGHARSRHTSQTLRRGF